MKRLKHIKDRRSSSTTESKNSPPTFLEKLEPRILLSGDGLLSSVAPDPLIDMASPIVLHVESLGISEPTEQQLPINWQIDLDDRCSDRVETDLLEPILTLSIEDNKEAEDDEPDDVSISQYDPGESASHSILDETDPAQDSVFLPELQGESEQGTGTETNGIEIVHIAAEEPTLKNPAVLIEDGSTPMDLNDMNPYSEYASSIDIRGPPDNSVESSTISNISTYVKPDGNMETSEGEDTHQHNPPNLPDLQLIDSDINSSEGQIFYLDFDDELGLTNAGPVTITDIAGEANFDPLEQKESSLTTRQPIPGELVLALGTDEISSIVTETLAEMTSPELRDAIEEFDTDELFSFTDPSGDRLNLVQVSYKGEADPIDVIEYFSVLDPVAWATPNYIYRGPDPRELIPNDPLYRDQYHLPLMQSDLAWDTTPGDPNIVVAVTDDGVDLDHEDLLNNIWVNTDEIPGDNIDNDANGYIDDVNGWDFSSGDNDPNPEGGSHGTHVAGIVAAETNNTTGVSGTAGGVTIMPLRWYGSGPWTSSIIAETFAYAVDNGAQIITTSYNMDGWVGDPVVEAGWQYLYDQGGLHFNSAGNNNQLNPPRQAFEQTLLVASTTAQPGDNDLKSNFSNYGTGIDIAAPGGKSSNLGGIGILSTLPNDTYGRTSGTSMAAPNAAGVAALIWSANPGWTRDQVAAQVVATADNIDFLNPGFEGLLGSGRVNAFRSVTEKLPPPQIESVTGLPPRGTLPINSFSIEYNQILDPTTAVNPVNYDLRADGGDGIFDTADDIIYTLNLPSAYLVGTNQINVEITDGPLAIGNYRFRITSGGVANTHGAFLDGDGDGTGGDDYEQYFLIEMIPPRVISSSIQQGDQCSAGTFIYQAVFDEELNTSSLDAADVSLVGAMTGVHTPVFFSYDALTSTLTLEFAELNEDSYTLTLISGDGAFEDLLGNDLDGEPLAWPIPPNVSGDGSAGGNFFVNFLADITTAPYPIPLEAKAPLGSLIYDPSVSAAINPSGDNDSFTIDVDPKQTITVVVDPDATLTPIIDMYDPVGDLIGSTITGAPGEDVVLQSVVASSAGTYTVTIDGAGTTGAYTMQIILNAAAELEEHDGQPNNNPPTAQDLDMSFVPLGNAAARAGVLGADAGNLQRMLTETFSSQTFDPAHWSVTTNASIDGIGLNETSPPYSARLNGNPSGGESIESVVIDLSNLLEAELSYYYEQTGGGESPDRGDDLFVEYFDGSDWIEVARHLGDDPDMTDYAHNTIALPVGALHADFQIRFGNQATTGAFDDWFIDDIELWGVEAGMDWYSFSLDDAESATLAVHGLGTSSFQVELYDSDGTTPLAVGEIAQNVNSVIRDFIDLTSDGSPTTYFAKVSGGTDPYSFIITRSSSFDIEPNGDSLADAQDITPVGVILGYAGGVAPDFFELYTSRADFDAAHPGLPVEDFEEGNVSPGGVVVFPGPLNENSNNAVFAPGHILPGISIESLDPGNPSNELVALGPGVIGNTSKIVGPNTFVDSTDMTFPFEDVFAVGMDVLINVSSAVDVSVYGPGGVVLGTTVVNTTPTGTFFGVAAGQPITQITLVSSNGELIDNVAFGPFFGDSYTSPAETVTPVEVVEPLLTAADLTSADRWFGESGIFSVEQGDAMKIGPLQLELDSKAPSNLTEVLGARYQAISPEAAGDPGDYYAFNVLEGDVVTIETFTPSDGPLEFINELDPGIEVFDPTGAVVSHTNVLGNETITFVAGLTGTYTVRVFAEDDALGDLTRGEYVLSVSGYTGALPLFHVVDSNPANGDRFSGVTAPPQITIDLNDSVLLTSVQASDLKIDGVHDATNVTIIDADTLVFDCPLGVWTHGFHDITIAGGAMVDLQGTPIKPFVIQIEIDEIAPQVTESSIMQGDVIPLSGSLTTTITYMADFDEELLASELDSSDVMLLGLRTGIIQPSSFNYSYNPSAGVADLVLEFEIEDDTYTLVLYSNNTGFQDTVGNVLDGDYTDTLPSGDGVPGGNFTVNFLVDLANGPFPVPLGSIDPPGSLIYDQSVGTAINPSGDTDSFTIDIDPKQTITVVVESAPGLLAYVELYDPSNTLLATAFANAPGEDVVLQTVVTTTAGTYTVSIGGATPGATQLFAFDWETGTLYDIARATGAASNPRPTGLAHIMGLAAGPDGMLYGVTTFGEPAGMPNALYTFDPVTGSATLIGATGLTGIIEGGMTFDPTSGRLYGVFNNSAGGDDELFILNTTTGVATVVGAIPDVPNRDASGIVFDGFGNLYAVDDINDELMRLNKNDASILWSIPLSLPIGTLAGMTIDPITSDFLLTDSDNDTLYLVDPNTGTLTAIGPTGVDNTSGLTGFPSRPGGTLGIDWNGDLYDVDLFTGATSNNRTTSVSLPMGIAFGPNGLLYSISASGDNLHIINPITGISTVVGPLGFDVTEGDLDYDPTSGILYGVQSSSRELFTVDPTTGIGTIVGFVDATTPDLSAMAFADDGTLFLLNTGSTGSVNQLLVVDKTTGAVIMSTSLIGPALGAVAGMDFDAVTGTLYVNDGSSGSSGTNSLYILNPTTGYLNLVGSNSNTAGLSGLEISGTGGPYTMQIILNSAVEEEAHNSSTNNSLATAQDIDCSFIPLGSGVGGRGAVIGSIQPEPLTVTDFEFAQHSDVGNPTMAGSYWYNASVGMHTVVGGGRDIWNSSDEFHYAYKTITGDFEMFARVRSFDDPDGINGWAKGGVMARETLAGGSKHANMLMSYSSGGASFQWRPETDNLSYSVHPAPNETIPYWVKLVRQGDQFSGFQSPNGAPGSWILLDTVTIDMPSDIYIGLAVTAHEEYDHLCTVEFDNVSITQPVSWPDWYSFSLADGESATMVVTALSGSHPVTVELYDAQANLLALGASANNIDQVIHNFVDGTNDGLPETYYLRVTGDNVQYSLVITRNADFDTELNDDLSQAQQITATGVALGHVKMAPAGSLMMLTARDAASSSVKQSLAVQSNLDFQPGRLIVHFTDSVSEEVKSDLVASLGGKILRHFSLINAAVVELGDAEADVLAEAETWSVNPSILYAQPDYLYEFVNMPNDPRFDDLWGLHNTGQTGGTPDADIDAPEAWDSFTGSHTTVVANFDSGVDYNHEDLIGNLWINELEIPGNNTDDDGNGWIDDIFGIDPANGDGDPEDTLGHGTHTAGTIGAVGDNGIGVTGVNWDVKIMSIKIGDFNVSTSAAVTGLDYVHYMKANRGVNIVAANNSWGGFGFDAALRDAILASTTVDNVAFIAAAGNNNRNNNDVNPFYPASYLWDGIISVAATDRDDLLAGFSNYGPISVDLGAPGVDVLSTTPGNTYSFYNGTSMATPHVTGAYAFLTGHMSGLTVAEYKETLLAQIDYAVDLDGLVLTDGRLNLANALAVMGDLGDYYAFEVNAGDNLMIRTYTPSDGPFEFANNLDPMIVLYDPTGMMVASDNNSAPDGRNAIIDHISTLSGTYVVRVLSSGESEGEYVVTVGGYTCVDPAPFVTDTNPDDGQRLPVFPETYTLEFSESMLVSSVEPADLLIGSRPALSVENINAYTYEFEIDPGVNVGDGNYLVELLPNSVSDLQGNTNAADSWTFVFDTTGPRIIGSSIQDGDTVAVDGTLQYVVYFDEELQVANLDVADVTLIGSLSGSHLPDLLNYDPVGSELLLEFTDLPEDNYTLILSSGDNRFEDVVGNDLDGEPLAWPIPPNVSGDGVNGGDFSVTFMYDVVVIDASEFDRLKPLGGLLSRSANTGLINKLVDEDDYAFFMEAGQTVSAVAIPDDPGLRLGLSFNDDPIRWGEPGEPIVLEPNTTEAEGTQTLAVHGEIFEGTSPFTLEIYSNTSLEILVGDSDDGHELTIDDSFVLPQTAAANTHLIPQVEIDISPSWGVPPDGIPEFDVDGELLEVAYHGVVPGIRLSTTELTPPPFPGFLSYGVTVENLSSSPLRNAVLTIENYGVYYGDPTGMFFLYETVWNPPALAEASIPAYPLGDIPPGGSAYAEVTMIPGFELPLFDGNFNAGSIGFDSSTNVPAFSDASVLTSFVDPGSGRYSVVGQSHQMEVTVDGVVWAVQPASGRILKIDPATGLILGSFAAPDALAANHTQIGLSIAEGGNSLIYVNSDIDPTTLYRLDPNTGNVLSIETIMPYVIDGLGFDTFSGIPVTIYSANMDSDPGWTFDAGSAPYLWEWGTPTGSGSQNLDPTSGYTGSNVVGYNLNGDYPNSLSLTQYATTPVINTSGFENVTLSFYRWLGVESASYDHATIEVSNDGTTWTTIWDHTGNSITDFSWNLQTYDISAVADNQSTVYVRWGMGPTDRSVTYPGWNIDDVVITGFPINPQKVVFLSHDSKDIHRQIGLSGPETFFWATGAPTGGLGGDDTGRQFGYFTDNLIHEYDPVTDTDDFISNLPAPALDIEGMAFDGINLYVSTMSGDLYTLDPNDGTVLNLVSVPSGGLFGLGAIKIGSSSSVFIDFEAFPGPDGQLGTADDITIDAPTLFSQQSEQLTEQFAPLGIHFVPNPSLEDVNEILNDSSFGTNPGSSPNILTSLGSVRNAIEAYFDFDVYEITAAIGIASGSAGDRLTIFSDTALTHPIGSVDGNNAIVNITSPTVIRGIRVENLDGVPPTLDDLQLISGGSLSVGGTISLPDIDEYWVTLAANQRIDIILAGQNHIDFSSETLELLDTDGNTVLATGRPDSLGIDAKNYDLGILDFVVPSDGVYTIRLFSQTEGDYGIVVTEAMTFDTEPNGSLSDPLRNFEANGRALGFLGVSEDLPELIYYPFDEGSGTQTANLADPGVGVDPAPVIGHTLTGTGQFGTALTGVTGEANKVDTGWVTDLGTGSWTVGMWLDVSMLGPTNPFMYLFGDMTAGSFRAFTNGAAGSGNVILRGPLNQVVITGGAPSTDPVVVAWVYNAAVPEIRGYLNGARVVTVPQVPLNISGTDSFQVGSYSDISDSLLTGAFIDEFRLYNRALTDIEVAEAWNIPLAGTSSTESNFDSQPLSLDAGSADVGSVAVIGDNAGVVYEPSFSKADHTEDTLAEFYLPPQQHLFNYDGYLSGPVQGVAALDLAMDFVMANAEQLGLATDDLEDLIITDQYVSSHTGVTHIYLRQTYNGLEVVNTSINVNISPDGRIINVGSRLVPDLGALTPLQQINPVLSAPEALVTLAEEFGWVLEAQPQIEQNPHGLNRSTVLRASGVSLEAIPAELKYVPLRDGGVELAWQLIVQTRDGRHWYDANVSALDGDVLYWTDWVDEASYEVFAVPVESPNHAVPPSSRTIEVNPANPLASPYAWHDTDGVAGAEFTITRGNNVHAYPDRNNDNVSDGSEPDGGAGLAFEFSLDLGLDPLVYQDAAVTNLFYWNNVLHDVHYQYGFDEASGNFQLNNYGRGGLGNDEVLAEAQDGADLGNRNNAYFSTPPDGLNPRMQMYLWNTAIPELDGDLDNGIIIHEYGHGVTNRLTGGPSNVGALNAIQSGGMGEGWSDWYSLMFTQEIGDTALDARGIGTYALNEPITGPGIRSLPYTYDFGVNNHTYRDIVGSSSVHFIGETWASTLWDLNWLLIEGNTLDPDLPVGLGYDPDLYTGTGGNNLALQLVTDGLKLQPANPSFLEGRDAILQADQVLTGGTYRLTIWKAFARRGMGYSADDGGNSGTTNVTEAFDLPGQGIVEFSDDEYTSGDVATIILRDIDLTGGTPVSVEVTSDGGDRENVNLAETTTIGRFEGTIPIFGSSCPTMGNGTLEAAIGETITVTYNDADDGTGNPAVVTDNASITLDIAPSGDFYTISLTAGEEITIGTGTPLDHPDNSPLNDLDPEIIVYTPSGQIAAQDQNSRDGKNAEVFFTASESGTYFVGVYAEAGAGEYMLDVNFTKIVQWASEVLGFSSEYTESHGPWSAIQASGEPNVLAYGDDPNAWCGNVANGTTEWIELGYDTPLYATEVRIRENWGNGFVTRVELRNASTGGWEEVWSGTDPSVPGDLVDFEVSFTLRTYLADAVRITTDTDHSRVWEEIDAVALCGTTSAPATVGDWVWFDRDGDGIQDSDEVGIEGVTVNLLNDDGSPTGMSMITDFDGMYSFTVIPGSYMLEFVAPSGNFTLQDVGTDDSIDSDADPITGRTIAFSLAPGANDTAWDAGLTTTPIFTQWASEVLGFSSEYRPSPDSWSAFQALGEPNVLAYEDDPSAWCGNMANGTTEWIALGYDTPVYATGVTIRESWGNGFVRRVDLRNALTGTWEQVWSGMDPSLPGDLTDFEVPFTLRSYLVDAVRIITDTDHSRVWEEIDAVALQGTTLAPAVVGDWVWFDQDEDGIQDGGEAGIEGVTVNLLNGNSSPTGMSTATDVNGRYTFTVIPGSYMLEFIVPNGMSFTVQDIGNDDAADSDADPMTGRTIAFLLAPEANVMMWDAGLTMAPIFTQWVGEVGGFGSEYTPSPRPSSVIRALGEPNILAYGDDLNAWYGSIANGTSEWIALGYDTPVYAIGETIWESWDNGFVTRIELRDALKADREELRFESDTSLPGDLVDYEVPFPLWIDLMDAMWINTETDHSYVGEEGNAVSLNSVITSGVVDDLVCLAPELFPLSQSF